MSNYKSNIKKLSKSIELLIKKEIKKKDLVDTGTLLKSIKATVKFSSDGFEIEIEGEDYFKYLDKENNILSDAFNSIDFNKIEDEITDAYADFLIEKI